MADGSQQGFNFTRPMVSALRRGEIIVDFFAGGGGASEALRQALGRDPDVAVNHDHLAIGMHAANHPFTRHMEADVWTVDILREVAGRTVGWFHASPDCTHFSQAKGGQPRDRATRSLSWVVLKVAGTLAKHGLAPRIISLENVRQILGWCPLVAKRDKATGRVVKLDGTVAAPGEHVPLREQFLVPDKRRDGRTWRQFEAALRALGYVVEHRILRACDYGAGTSRERLFLIARRSAAEPFIVQCANASANGIAPSSAPLGVVTAWPKGGAHAVVAPTLVQTGYGERQGQAPRALDLQQPLGTAVGGGVKHAVAAAHLVKFRGESKGADAQDPLPTITSGAGAARPAGAAHAMGILTAFLEQAHGGGEHGNPARARGADEPVSTISTTGSQQRLVTADLAALSPEHEAGALRVAAFLINYYGNGQALDLTEPVDTVTTRDRLALVTVTIRGTPYVIVDIGLRMLRREELYRAQGFPPDYIIDRTADGTPLSISASVRMVGNSVSPPPLAACARANLEPATEREALAA